MKPFKILLYISTLAPLSTFAFFCPTNFTQIDIGLTEEQVLTQCGKPDKEERKNVQIEGPQEWSYYITQTVATSTMAPSQGTLKTQITFDASGKAVNISVNGIGVGASNICGNSSIQLGDTRERIKAACGSPSFINSQQATGGEEKEPDKKTTYIYNNTSPPTKLIFINGKLTKRE